MRYVITYHLTDRRLEVRSFGFLPVSTTSYDLVDEVRINDYLKAFFWPLSWVWMFNRLVGSFVVVRQGAEHPRPRMDRVVAPGVVAGHIGINFVEHFFCQLRCNA